jgi:prephenate dehydrogenase
MTPSAHDAAVALTSHVPQVLASWLAAAADDMILNAAGPAFADMTRVAGGNEAIWKDIFRTNAGPIAAVLNSASEDLRNIAQSLALPEPKLDPLLQLLSNARARSRQHQSKDG